MFTGVNNSMPELKKYRHFITVKLSAESLFSVETKSNGEAEHRKDAEAILQQICRKFFNLHIRKLFTSLSEQTISALLSKAKETDSSYVPENLLLYYYILCPADTHPDEVIGVLLKSRQVEFAYLQGRKVLPSINNHWDNSFSATHYIHPAPAGINAKYAWAQTGGKGQGNVQLIDIEQGWHQDSTTSNIRTLPLTGTSHDSFRDHGTAVLGIILMKENEGGSGLAPEATGYIISPWRPDGIPNEADAILTAISYLHYGDIILLESQAFHFETENKLWPIEIQEAIFQVIRLATALGIIVIEAAGNGDMYKAIGNDLDLFKSNNKYVLNPASADFRDSGAILVSASLQDIPPQRKANSNFGRRINCFASGEHSGYYKKKINSTSGASAIIAGATVIIQSITEAKYGKRLSPYQMRNILSHEKYGTTSTNGHDVDKIGVMPDLKKIIDVALNIFANGN
jgi:hypothetical protein